MPRLRLYSDLAWLWPVLSPPEDYRREADAARLSIYRALGLSRVPRSGRMPTLLDLGTGGGHFLSHLTHAFDATALDKSRSMTRLCRELNPAARVVMGDFRTARLRQSFDAVILHDAVSYMATRSDLLRALKTVRVHLDGAGVGLVMPDYLSETFIDNEGAEADVETHDGFVRVLSEVSRGDHTPRADARRRRHPERFTLTMTFAITRRRATNRKGHSLATDRHVCGLFDLETWRDLIQRAGLIGTLCKKDVGRSGRVTWEPVRWRLARSRLVPGEGEFMFMVRPAT